MVAKEAKPHSPHAITNALSPLKDSLKAAVCALPDDWKGFHQGLLTHEDAKRNPPRQAIVVAARSAIAVPWVSHRAKWASVFTLVIRIKPLNKKRRGWPL